MCKSIFISFRISSTRGLLITLSSVNQFVLVSESAQTLVSQTHLSNMYCVNQFLLVSESAQPLVSLNLCSVSISFYYFQNQLNLEVSQTHLIVCKSVFKGNLISFIYYLLSKVIYYLLSKVIYLMYFFFNVTGRETLTYISQHYHI